MLNTTLLDVYYVNKNKKLTLISELSIGQVNYLQDLAEVPPFFPQQPFVDCFEEVDCFALDCFFEEVLSFAASVEFFAFVPLTEVASFFFLPNIVFLPFSRQIAL